jgi:hypothetical protein
MTGAESGDVVAPVADPMSGIDLTDPDAMAAFLQQMSDGAGGGESDALGGFFKDRFGEDPSLNYQPGAVGGSNAGILSEAYREGSQWSILNTMNTVERVELQATLANLGFIRASYRPGKMDDATMNGFADVLTLANREGLNYNRIIAQETANLAAGRQSLVGGGSESGRVYSMPDTDTLKGKVRTEFQTTLGRDPTQAEMRMFTDSMMGDFASSVGQQKAADDFRSTGAGREMTQTEIDPVASFREKFLARAQPEIQSNERQMGTNDAALGTGSVVDEMEREVLS